MRPPFRLLASVLLLAGALAAEAPQGTPLLSPPVPTPFTVTAGLAQASPGETGLDPSWSRIESDLAHLEAAENGGRIKPEDAQELRELVNEIRGRYKLDEDPSASGLGKGERRKLGAELDEADASIRRALSL